MVPTHSPGNSVATRLTWDGRTRLIDNVCNLISGENSGIIISKGHRIPLQRLLCLGPAVATREEEWV